MNLRCFVISAFLILSACSVNASDCEEKFRIDTVWYSLSAQWCGKRIDSNRLPSKDNLARVPLEFSFEDSRIYLEKTARDSFVAMAEAALSDSIRLVVKSGYRSAAYQKQVIVRRLGEGQTIEQILKYVAPPGYSEHETGRAIDLTADTKKFAESKAYQWLKKNARRFGFEEIYALNNKQKMPWEPWHWQFVVGE